MRYFILILVATGFFLFNSCRKDNSIDEPKDGPFLVFKFRFDSTQARLNNFGQPQGIPNGHGAQSPRFNKISAHYIELAPDSFTLLGQGKVLYMASETNAGGSTAIDFSKSITVSENEVFLRVPLSSISAGTYKWLRVSLSYQNYDIQLRSSGFDFTGTVASFIGYNTYISSFRPKNQLVTVNQNKLQGYWAFETSIFGMDTVISGDASNTTVPNPIASTSPIPAGSCVVTGAFSGPLIITGNETNDINVLMSLSINNSFEWTDDAGNNIYEPPQDVVVDMGIRGLIPYVSY
ncbi:MAG: hypothetical protein DWQ44_08150 [Bacteroidetes bacterium]|nr:MAG: hypothetical protein DWQ33_01550 [Bacteroidota bacterium]REK07045.1 MAG: hypothetical protein DWQ39_02540 [Bacteroidota bacterium]REK33608.1 MAG: hypothetical protein DWQ44_08150 [Bacteroidota bacterium]REK48593.1 MAG: hypothetical protein DWQ48_09585 [Bacteroidota bacterium]